MASNGLSQPTNSNSLPFFLSFPFLASWSLGGGIFGGGFLISESEIIALIRSRFPGGTELTDDCGAIPHVPHTGKLLVTTDLMESGQHFNLDWHPPEFLGRKLLMVNLSDLDASGARPLGFTLTLAVGRDIDRAWLIRFLDGLASAAKAARTPIMGGDTVGRASGLGLGITAFGAARHWLRRDTMQVGDQIYVDQPLGLSLGAFESSRRVSDGTPGNRTWTSWPT